MFRNFPLTDVHPNAQAAALAAEAAALQDKFWEMHDALFEHQSQLDAQHLADYAKQLGLNAEQFDRDRQQPAPMAKIETDFESGIRSGVNGTPSFFVNGHKYDGDWQGSALVHYLMSQLR